MNGDQYAVVHKVRALLQYPDKGIVKPLVLEDKHGLGFNIVDLADPSDFPNTGDIFVHEGYEDALDSYEDNELFRIRYWANNSPEQDTNKYNYCKYATRGDEASRLDRFEYLHLVLQEFNPDNRKLTLAYKPERLIVIKSPLTDELYGPFDYNLSVSHEQETYEVILKPYSGLTKFHVPENHILQLTSYQFPVLTLPDQLLLLAKVEDMTANDYEAIDYIADDLLLKLGNNLLQSDKMGKLTRNELTSFRNAIADLPGSDADLTEARKSRLLRLAEKLDLWISQNAKLITDYMKTEDGQAKVDQYIKDHVSDFVSFAEEIAEKETREPRKRLDEEIRALADKKSKLVSEIESLTSQSQSERSEDKAEELNEKIAELQSLATLKEEEIKQKNEEIEALVTTFNLAKSNKGLLDDIHYRERRIDDLKRDEERLKEVKDALIKEINQNDNSRKQKLIEVARDQKPYLDILNGILPTFAEEVQNKPKQIHRNTNIVSSHELVRGVLDKLDRHFGRTYQFEDIANILICINQNFLTVLSGLPGVGKTSMINCLADVLGLKSQGCFLGIPTARGFTSQRDVLGFYNPLNQRFQPASTGLYEMLHELNKSKAQTSYPHWVLLDEANLSPMEHYFSSFLGMCDLGSSKQIKTGGPGSDGVLEVPASFRFLATINTDNTTEPLSPRMIDRVPIIRIEPPSEDNIVFPSFEQVDEPLFSYSDMERILQPSISEENEGIELTPAEEAIYRGVKEALSRNEEDKGMPTIISPRKTNAIRQYCYAARELMRGEKGTGDTLTALDYAILQHVLPLLNGHGDKYQKRLTELEKAVSPLDRSRRMLDSIIRTGDEEQKFYRYFV